MDERITIIKKVEKIHWDKPYNDDYSLFKEPIDKNYDCYKFLLLPNEIHSSILFQITPRLEIHKGNTLLLNGILTINYECLNTENSKFPDLLKHILKLSHEEFIKLFKEKAISTPLMDYEPHFEEDLVNQYIELLLTLRE